MTKVKELDFTGTTIFCGLDVHKLSWRINIRDSDLELKDFTQPADAGCFINISPKIIPVQTIR